MPNPSSGWLLLRLLLRLLACGGAAQRLPAGCVGVPAYRQRVEVYGGRRGRRVVSRAVNDGSAQPWTKLVHGIRNSVAAVRPAVSSSAWKTIFDADAPNATGRSPPQLFPQRATPGPGCLAAKAVASAIPSQTWTTSPRRSSPSSSTAPFNTPSVRLATPPAPSGRSRAGVPSAPMVTSWTACNVLSPKGLRAATTEPVLPPMRK